MDMNLEIPEHTLSRQLDGQTVLLNLESGQYYKLNETGSILWEAIQAGKTPADAVETIIHEYEVDPGRAAADVEGVLRDLVNAGLCVEVKGDAGV